MLLMAQIFLVIGLDSFLCEFVTNSGNFLDFEETLSLCSVKLIFSDRSRTACRRVACLISVSACTVMSSMSASTPSNEPKCSCIRF